VVAAAEDRLEDEAVRALEDVVRALEAA